MEGVPEAVMDYYNAMLADHQNQSIRQESLGNGKTQIISSGDPTEINIYQLSEEEREARGIKVLPSSLFRCHDAFSGCCFIDCSIGSRLILRPFSHIYMIKSLY